MPWHPNAKRQAAARACSSSSIPARSPKKPAGSPPAPPPLSPGAPRPALPLEGLMCFPPADDDAAPHFAFLAKLAREHGLANLSMGMSGDFELAVKFGATE